MPEEENPDSRIKTIEEYHEPTPRRWPLLIAYAVAAVVIALLIVFGARAIYHHYHKHTANQTTSKQTSSTNKKSTASKKTPLASPPPPSSPTTAPNPASLPNNGPGNVVAIFIGSSLAAAGLHYLYRLRRVSSN